MERLLLETLTANKIFYLLAQDKSIFLYLKIIHPIRNDIWYNTHTIGYTIEKVKTIEHNESIILNNFLNAYWLRPESALWRSIDTTAMKDFKFQSPSLDFGSGDGVFSFIRAGGEFAKDFDVFSSVNKLSEFYHGVDIFDSYNPSMNAKVTKKPLYQIDVAFDAKDNLLEKASRIDMYKQTICGDGNKKLPFADNSFVTIFSNIVYWLDNPQNVLKELHRILNKNGKICLMIPDKKLEEFSIYNKFYAKTQNPQWEFLKMIDRNRFADNYKTIRLESEWEELFTNTGFEIISHGRHLSKLVIELWDIGLRPIFPLLLKMVNELNSKQIYEIKSEWTETFKPFLKSIIEIDKISDYTEKAFHCYVLQK